MSDMERLTERAERLVSALSDAIMATTEVAAERIQLAAQVAQVQQRMAAFGAVLDAIAAQKAPLLERMEAATGAQRALLARQVELLSAQEASVLEKAGAPPVAAAKAVELIEHRLDEQATHARRGRKFVPVANGHQG